MQVYRHDTQLEAASDAFCQQTPIVNGPEYSAGYSFLNALMKLAPPKSTCCSFDLSVRRFHAYSNMWCSCVHRDESELMNPVLELGR